MYKKILVPVDGSPTSVCGLRESIKLAKQFGATLRLVHVVHELLLDSDQPHEFSYDAYRKTMREEGQRTVSAMLAIAREQGIEAESLLLETFARRTADLIIEAAREWQADVIVMGTHGRRGLKRLLMGSDASLVLQQTCVPVMLVRMDAPEPQTDEARRVA